MKEKIFICNKNTKEKVEVKSSEIVNYLLSAVSDVNQHPSFKFDSKYTTFIVDEATFAEFTLERLFKN